MTGRQPAMTIVVLAMALSLAACSAAASPSASPAASVPPTSTPAPTPADSPEPSPTGTPAPTGTPVPTGAPGVDAALHPDGFARVVTDDLRVRSEPFVGDDSQLLEPLLWNGAELFVIDGPVAGSGYEWYLVQPLSEVDVQIHPDPPSAGWVAAASKDGEPWLEPFTPECYDTPLGWLQYELVSPPADLSGLSCFGDQPVEFQAWFSIVDDTGCVGTSGPWTIDPAWLETCKDPIYQLADPDDDLTGEVHALQVTVHPSVDLAALPTLEPDHWLLVDVVGQYAHPAADDCVATPTGGDGEAPPRPEVVVLGCRSQFVVTQLTAHQDT